MAGQHFKMEASGGTLRMAQQHWRRMVEEDRRCLICRALRFIPIPRIRRTESVGMSGAVNRVAVHGLLRTHQAGHLRAMLIMASTLASRVAQRKLQAAGSLDGAACAGSPAGSHAASLDSYTEDPSAKIPRLNAEEIPL